MTIRKEGNKYVVRSEKGKNLGKYSSRAGAARRLQQVEYFKHKAAGTAHGIKRK